jgi:hypothetical protein
MSAAARQLALNLFIYPAGHHEAAWRYRRSSPERVFDIGFYQDLAQRAEAAKFDAIFFADGPSLPENVRYSARVRFEPLTWLAAIAAVTQKIGLIATASTTYNQPYNLARLFASLDHLSHGRAGWNIVTTSDAGAAANFGLPEHPPHGERYETARELAAGRGAGALGVDRDTGYDRGRNPDLVRDGGGGRVQRHAALADWRVRRVRGRGGADPAQARLVPRCVYRVDAARPLRAAAARERIYAHGPQDRLECDRRRRNRRSRESHDQTKA